VQLTQTTSSITGQRLYIDSEGLKYPSISTLAGKFWSSYPIYLWKVKLGRAIAATLEDGHLLTDKELARLGYEESEKIKNDSAARGTAVHLSIETSEPTGNPEYDAYVEQYRLKVAPYLEILHQEITLAYITPDNMRMAGKADIVGHWRSELAICDMKTSEDAKKTQYMGRFALQLSAYALCFEQGGGDRIDKGVVFNLTPTDAHIFHIPLEPAKEMLLENVLPAFYRYYQTPEPRVFANQFENMGTILQNFEKSLAKSITIE
jgi:CRISPR/Cas system-associated exonuclease Cas4 (RecB family)